MGEIRGEIKPHYLNTAFGKLAVKTIYAFSKSLEWSMILNEPEVFHAVD